MARERQNKHVTYLSLNKRGALSISVKEPTDGFKEEVSKDGHKYWVKEFSGTEYGYISRLEVREAQFESGKVKYLIIGVENDDSIDYVQLPLMYEKALSPVVRNTIPFLPNLDFGRRLTITSNLKKNDRGYVDKVLFFTYVDDKDQREETVKYALDFKNDKTIPRWEKVEGIDGKETYDTSKQDKFLFDILKKEIDRFQNFKEKNIQIDEVEKEVLEVAPSPVIEEDEENDLPF